MLSDIGRKDIITFLGSSPDRITKFVILFGDIGNVRIARIVHAMEVEEPDVSDTEWIDVDYKRTVLSVDVIKNEMGDGFVFSLNKICFYNSEWAIRLIKMIDDYDLEFFEIKMDNNIFE